jgi:glucans biosynthesis protein
MLLRHLSASLIALAFFSTAPAQENAPPPVRTFLDLEAYASQLAQKPYVPPQSKLDPFYEGLNYDGHRQIRSKPDNALFKDSGSGFEVEFFHPGWMFKKTVEFHSIVDGQPKAVPFDQGRFKYGDLKVPENVVAPLGYSGFRLEAVELEKDRRLEFLSCLGASYFRAVPLHQGWGLSARGIAINTTGGAPEEFPDFTHIWFIQPKAGEKSFKFYALLNGPSVTGAYEFEATPGEETLITVSGSVFLRKVVNQLGIAPFSSMFWFGENTHPKALDFRPEVHDSDGLLIEQNYGPIIWRPLDNSKDLRQSVFNIESLKGFGLLQRDREFSHYQDLEAKYHKRTAVWVEPIEGFGRGALHLIEIPTGEETWDNVVLMWEPDHFPTATEPLRFAYKMHWQGEHEHNLAKVTSTRYGEAIATPKNPIDYLFVVDFTKGKVPDDAAADWTPTMELTIPPEAKLLDKRVIANAESGGWRAFFIMDVPPELKLLEMNCELSDGKQPMSERWSYQWKR